MQCTQDKCLQGRIKCPTPEECADGELDADLPTMVWFVVGLVCACAALGLAAGVIYQSFSIDFDLLIETINRFAVDLLAFCATVLP